MGLLNSIVEWLVAFGAGFFGHVVAHDFCEVMPMISRKIVEAAASQLPPLIRDRYLEEWHADLREQSGALAKLKWSIGCLICSRRMRRAATLDRRRRTSFELTFDNGETIAANVTTFAFYYVSVVYLYRWRRFIKWAPDPAKLLGLQCALAITSLIHRHWGPPDHSSWMKMLRLWANGGSIPTKITRLIDGVAVGSAHVQGGELIDDELH